jgi:hypothetical protein
MIKFEVESEEIMIDFMKNRFLVEPNINLVVSIEIAEELLDEVTFKYKSLIKEINDEEYVYLISKDTTSEGIYLCIEPVMFDLDEGYMDMDIEGSFIIIQDGLLDEDDLESVTFSEECIIVDYNDDCKDFEDEDEDDCEEECNECCRNYCEGCNNEEDFESCNCECECCNECEDMTEEENSGIAIGNALKSIFPRIVENKMEDRLTEFEEMLEESDEDVCVHCSILKLLTDNYLEAYYNGFEGGKATITEELENLLDKITE